MESGSSGTLQCSSVQERAGTKTVCPWFVNHLSMDGVRVNVTLFSKRKDRIQGRKELDDKGYGTVTGVCDLQRDRRGVFASVAPIDDAIKHLGLDWAAFIEICGRDPGLVSLLTDASARLHACISAADFLSSDPATGKGFTETRSQDYRYQSLTKRAQRFEVERRKACPQYAAYLDAVAAAGSSKFPSQLLAHMDAKLSILTDASVMSELFSVQRREFAFARHRAQNRAVDRMVRVVFGSSDEASAIRADKAQEARPNARRASRMKAMTDFLAGGKRYRTRVAFMGKGIFGPGARGPCPRKKLIRAMAQRVCDPRR